MKLGLYPSFFAALKTYRLVSSETLFPSEKARDTADCDTPAARATSVDDGYLRPGFIATF